MEKRLILAIALSLLILLSWSTWVSKTYHIENKEVIKEAPPAVLTALAQITQAAPEPEILPASFFPFAQEKYTITFSEPQAAIKEIIFQDYQSYKFPLEHGFRLTQNNWVFKQSRVSRDEVVFLYRDQEKEVSKKFLFHNSSYNIDLEIKIRNLSSAAIKTNLTLSFAGMNFSGDQNRVRFQDVTLAGKDGVQHSNGRQELALPEIKFLGFRDKYFCAIIEPLSDRYSAWITKLNPKESEIGLTSQELTLAPAEIKEQKFRIYLGPQDLQLMQRINPEWSSIVHYGTFNFIAHILRQLLEFLFRLVHNWGWTIIIFSLLIYLVLYPLTLKQMRSMKEMQSLQPQIEELRKTYKDNPQKLNKEIMELYRQHRVNPFGGCLPMILQIPIFFALYQVLMRSVALKGAHFLWIKDLSEPDRLLTLPRQLPVIGNEINILPIVMGIGMFFQQKISQAAGTGSTEQQKIMTIMFPLMFGFIFYHMPSGLVLYWFINSAMMLFYQLRINRKK